MKKLLASLLLLACAVPAHSAIYTWTGTTSGTQWSLMTNWNPNTALPSSGDDALFNANASKTVTLDASQTISSLLIGYNTGAVASSNAITLTNSSATTLTVGSASQGGLIVVGGAGTGVSGAATANALTVSQTITLTLVGGAFNVGAANSGITGGTDLGGTVTVNGGILNVGDSTNRSAWSIGVNRRSSNSSGADSGTVQATSAKGGTLSAYLSDLSIGSNYGTANTLNGSKATGNLNLTSFSSAMVNVNTLEIGTSTGGTATGSFSLGAGSLAVNTSLSIATASGSGGAYSTAEAKNVETGAFTMGEGSTVALGTVSSPVSVALAESSSTRGLTVSQTATFVATGGTFSGYMSSLTIGSQNAVPTTATNVNSNSQTFNANGTMDLRQASITAFKVTGDVKIGYSGVGEGSIGKLYLSKANASIGGNLWVGDSKVGGLTPSGTATQVASSGLFSVGSAQVTVAGNVYIGLTGQVLVTVEGDSAGLWLSDTSTFSIANTTGTSSSDPLSGYYITFSDPTATSGIYYGLAWSGNHLTEVQALVAAHEITWQDNMSLYDVGVYYDSGLNLTYIGTSVPEPSTYALMTLGVALLVGVTWKRRMV